MASKLLPMAALLWAASAFVVLPANETGEEIAQLAAGKRDAILKITVDSDPGWEHTFTGVFISEKGLALVSLSTLARTAPLRTLAADGSTPEPEAVLGVFAEQGLALMKFRHSPKSWLELAPEEPEIHDLVALLPQDMNDPWKKAIAPVVGPVLAKWCDFSPNLLKLQFVRMLSIGAATTREQRGGLSPGCFAIDSDGRLVGFMGGTKNSDGQVLLGINPVASIAGELSELAEGGVDLGYPLPEHLNLLDPATFDNDFRSMDLAGHAGDEVKRREHLEALLKRYPRSPTIRRLASGMPSVAGNPLIPLAELKLDPSTSNAEKVWLHSIRASRLFNDGDLDGAIAELKASLELQPANFPNTHTKLAKIYFNLDRLEEAEKFFREAYSRSPERIRVAEALEVLLIRRQKFEEADKFTERVFELEDIYQSK